MAEGQRILDLVDRACRGGAWHGPSILEVLDGVGPKLAAKRLRRALGKRVRMPH
jgi:hypothetical protein